MASSQVWPHIVIPQIPQGIKPLAPIYTQPVIEQGANETLEETYFRVSLTYAVNANKVTEAEISLGYVRANQSEYEGTVY